MSDQNENQLEFFDRFHKRPAGSIPSTSAAASSSSAKRISWERLTVGAILFLFGMVIAFILGVEKGKRIPRPLAAVPPVARRTAGAGQSSVINARVTTGVNSSLPPPAPAAPALVRVPAVAVPPAAKTVSRGEPAAAAVYTIQVMSIGKNEESLKTALARLKKMGHEPFFRSTQKHFVVCVGRFAVVQDAGPVLKRLRNNFPDCFVTRLERKP